MAMALLFTSLLIAVTAGAGANRHAVDTGMPLLIECPSMTDAPVLCTRTESATAGRLVYRHLVDLADVLRDADLATGVAMGTFTGGHPDGPRLPSSTWPMLICAPSTAGLTCASPSAMRQDARKYALYVAD